MGDAEQIINQLYEDLREIKERLHAIEKEQRRIREDILSGEPKERMQKRLLQQPKEKITDKKEKIDNEIKIEI